MEQVHRQFEARGVRVLAVNIMEPRSRVAAWVKDHGLTMPVLLDTAGTVTDAYRVTATPTVFVVDRRGHLVGKAIGPKEWATPKGQALFEALLRD